MDHIITGNCFALRSRKRAGWLACIIMAISCAVSGAPYQAVVTTGALSGHSPFHPMLAEIHMMPDGYAPSMAEVAKTTEPPVATPDEALERLKRGNAHFFSGYSTMDRNSANIRRAQIVNQTPFAVVLGCSDSRVPIEIVFDQGLGDIFVIRVAGNIADPGTLGSIEYAVRHLNSKILVVMGHEGCGAVSAAMLPQNEQDAEPENVRYLLKSIAPSVKGLPAIRDKKARMREAVIANVRLQTAKLRENPEIVKAEKEGRIRIVGAFYEISSGAVDFLETEEELAITPQTATSSNH